MCGMRGIAGCIGVIYLVSLKYSIRHTLCIVLRLFMTRALWGRRSATEASESGCARDGAGGARGYDAKRPRAQATPQAQAPRPQTKTKPPPVNPLAERRLGQKDLHLAERRFGVHLAERRCGVHLAERRCGAHLTERRCGVHLAERRCGQALQNARRRVRGGYCAATTRSPTPPPA